MFERKNLPIVDLKQRYESGESLETLAVAYGVHRQTVSTRLREAGVKIRSRRNHKAFKYSPEIIERMKELRAQGVKYEAIAMELGCASSTVYVHLAAYRNEHRPVLVEMRDILRGQLKRHLTALDNGEHRKERETRLETIKKLEARVAALESVI